MEQFKLFQFYILLAPAWENLSALIGVISWKQIGGERLFVIKSLIQRKLSPGSESNYNITVEIPTQSCLSEEEGVHWEG